MSIEHKSLAVKNFWIEWANVGQELIEHGEQVVFGHSLLEVKYVDSVPAVIILSKSMKTKYPTNNDAKMAVAKLLEDTERAGFIGSRTLTITYDKGLISHILLDEYGNKLIR